MNRPIDNLFAQGARMVSEEAIELTLEARHIALEAALDIQRRVNAEAARLDRPRLDLINDEEEARIRELIALGTWPDGWGGDAPTGNVYPAVFNQLKGKVVFLPAKEEKFTW